MDDGSRTTTRRDFLRRISFSAAAAAFLTGRAVEAGSASMKVGTKSADASCNDTGGLTEDQIRVRKALKYTDASPHADKRCNNCKFFKKPTGDDPCGACTAVPGPIHPQGFCSAWVAP